MIKIGVADSKYDYGVFILTSGQSKMAAMNFEKGVYIKWFWKFGFAK